MIFSELYSAYYQAVAAILSQCRDGCIDSVKMRAVTEQFAFAESALTILPSLQSGKWQLLRPDMRTTLKHPPTMPLTNIQKQWLKAISLDPRIRLFDVQLPELEEVIPLFTAQDVYFYDRYTDGDPFEDEGYGKNFRIVLSSIREKTPLSVCVRSHNDTMIRTKCFPVRLEYSEKDDKFRLITSGSRYLRVIRLSNLVSCEKITDGNRYPLHTERIQSKIIEITITDKRNALERCMMHFSHFEKQAYHIDADRYLLKIRYDERDEAELVIRILSFGPMIEVTAPQEFRNLMIDKLKKQQLLDIF